VSRLSLTVHRGEGSLGNRQAGAQICRGEEVSQPTVVALGNFDGVHRGHQAAIAQLGMLGGGIPTVVSFDPHPREFFSGQSRLWLTPLPEKAQCLGALGIGQLVVLPFDETLAQRTAAEFMAAILQDQLQAQGICVGEDFRFGWQRQGTVVDLRRVWGDRLRVLPAQTHRSAPGDPAVRISSSAIRTALERGEMALAQDLLGRPYTLTGEVVPGHQNGRRLGFPTANLRLHPKKFRPRPGVYSGWVRELGLPAAINLGQRPTLDGTGEPTVEAHILDWQGDLYGQTLTVTLERFLRPEQRFASLPALQEQIARDCAAVRRYAGEVLVGT